MIVGIVCHSRERKKTLFLRLVFGALILLFALRASTVGRDICGYKNAYETTRYVSWKDYGYIYFEVGYIFIMKVSIAIGMQFQMFMVAVSIIILAPIYLVIKKYSTNPLLSTLIYVCFMFMEFDLTALRQAISMSICLIAYIVLIESKQLSLLKSIAIAIAATLFHNGAYAFLFIYFAVRVKSLKKFSVTVFALACALILCRTTLLNYIKNIFARAALDVNASMYIGLNFICTIILAVLFVFTEVTTERIGIVHVDCNSKVGNIDVISTKIYLLGILCMILFGTDSGARSYMNLSQIMIVLVPNCFAKWDRRSRTIMNLAFGVFLIVFFFTNTLLPNNFDIVPYCFFWQTITSRWTFIKYAFRG